MLKRLWAAIRYNWFLAPKPIARPLHNCEEAGCFVNSSQKNGVNTLGNKTNSKGV